MFYPFCIKKILYVLPIWRVMRIFRGKQRHDQIGDFVSSKNLPHGHGRLLCQAVGNDFGNGFFCLWLALHRLIKNRLQERDDVKPFCARGNAQYGKATCTKRRNVEPNEGQLLHEGFEMRGRRQGQLKKFREEQSLTDALVHQQLIEKHVIQHTHMGAMLIDENHS